MDGQTSPGRPDANRSERLPDGQIRRIATTTRRRFTTKTQGRKDFFCASSRRCGEIAFMEITDKNIVLIGMRGSGKTTVGAILAGCLHRELIPMDALIVYECGMTVPEIVAAH